MDDSGEGKKEEEMTPASNHSITQSIPLSVGKENKENTQGPYRYNRLDFV